MPRTRLASLSALAVATVLSACGQSPSATSNSGATGAADGSMPPAEVQPSPNQSTDASIARDPTAPAAVGADGGTLVTPANSDAAYNRGAGNANVGPGNDGSAGTMESGKTNPANLPPRNPPG